MANPSGLFSTILDAAEKGEDPQEAVIDDLIEDAQARPEGASMRYFEDVQEKAEKRDAEREELFKDQPEVLAAIKEGDARVSEQISSLNNIVSSQGLQKTAANRLKVVDFLLHKALTYDEQVAPGVDPDELEDPLTADEFTALNILAQRQMGKVYESPRDLVNNLGGDLFAFHQSMDGVQGPEQPAPEFKGAYRDGRMVASSGSPDPLPIDTEEALKVREMLDRLPEDEVWRKVATQVRRSAANTPQEEARLNDAAFGDDDLGRVYYRKANRIGIDKGSPVLAANALVPIYEDPTKRTTGIDLQVTEETLRRFYTDELRETDPDLDETQIKQQVTKKVDEDIARIKRTSKSFISERNERSLRRFYAGESAAGWVGKNFPSLRPLMSLFVNERETAGVYKDLVTGEVVEAARPGALEMVGDFILPGGEALTPGDSFMSLADNSIVRGLDSIIRFDLSEVHGAAFNLALKDYARDFGPIESYTKESLAKMPREEAAKLVKKSAHRAEYVKEKLKSDSDLWKDDRLVLEIASGTDNAGRLLTQYGEIMLGPAGEVHPFWSNVGYGTLWFLFMVSPFSLNPLNWLAPAARLVSTMNVGRKKLAVRAGLTVENTMLKSGEAALKAVKELADKKIDPIELQNRLQKIADKDPDFRIQYEFAGRDLLADLNKMAQTAAEGDATAMPEAVFAIQRRVKEMEARVKEFEDAVDVARTTEDLTKADEATLQAIRSLFQVARDEIEIVQAVLQQGRRDMVAAQKELQLFRSLDRLMTPSSGTASAPDFATARSSFEQAAELGAIDRDVAKKLADQLEKLTVNPKKTGSALDDAKAAWAAKVDRLLDTRAREDFAKVISGQTAKGRTPLTDKLDEALDANNVTARELTDEMDGLFRNPVLEGDALKTARQKWADKVNDLLKNSFRPALRAREAALIAKVNTAMQKQIMAVNKLKEITKKAGLPNEQVIADELARLMTQPDGEAFVRLKPALDDETARLAKALDNARETVRTSEEDLKALQTVVADGLKGMPLSDEATKTVADLLVGHLQRQVDAFRLLSTPEGVNSLEAAVRSANSAAGLGANPLTREAAELRKIDAGTLNALSDDEFFGALAEVDVMTRAWKSAPFLNKSKLATLLSTRQFKTGKGAVGSILSSATTWVAVGGMIAKNVLDIFPVFRMRVSLIGNKFNDDLIREATLVSNLCRQWETDLSIISARGNRADIDDLTIQYLGGSDRIYLRGRVIPLPADMSPFKNQRYELTGNVGLNDNILDLAIRGMAGTGRGFARTAGNLEETITELPQSIVGLRGFVYSVVKDKIGANYLPKVDAAVIEFAKKISAREDELLAITDPAIKMRALQDLVRESLKVGKVPANSVLKLDTIPQRSKNLGYRALMAAAGRQRLAERVNNVTSGAITLRNQRAMRVIVEGHKAKGLSARASLEIGDMVVDNRQAARFRKIIYGTQGAELAATLRKPLSPTLEKAVKGRLSGTDVEDLVPKTRRLEKIVEEDGVVYGVVLGKAGSEKIPLSDLSLLEPEFAWIDFVDTLSMFGKDLIQTAYKVRFEENMETLRYAYGRMIMHSIGPDGRVYMIPDMDSGLFSKSLNNIVKDLNVNLSPEAMRTPGWKQTARSLSGLLSVWRQAKTVGLIIAKPAFTFFVWSGDALQMLTRDGMGKALVVGGLGGLGYIPGIGPWAQTAFRKGTSQMMRAYAAGTAKLPTPLRAVQQRYVPLPTMFDAAFNSFLDDVYKGVNEFKTYTLANGKTLKVNPALVRSELNMSPLEATFRGEDYFAMTERMARRALREVEPGLRAQGLETAEDMVATYANLMDTMLRAGNRRQRELYMLDEVFIQGKTWNEARDNLAYTLYDYTRSIGRFESQYIAKLAAFYVYSKNFLLSHAMSFFDGSDDLAKYTKDMLLMQTKQQRILAMSRFSEVLRPGEYIDPSRVLSFEEQERLLAERRVPYFYENYLANTPKTLSPEGIALAKELKQDWEQYMVTYGSPVPALEALNIYTDFANIFTGAVAALVGGEEVDFSSQAASDAVVEQLLRLSNPAFKGYAEGAMGLLTGYKPSARAGGAKNISAQEAEFINWIDSQGFEELRRSFVTVGKPEKATRIKSSDFLIKSGILRILADETNRVRLLSTLYFGEETAPASIRVMVAGEKLTEDEIANLSEEEQLALIAEKKDKKAKALAFLNLVGVVNVRMWRGDQQQGYRVSDELRYLRAKTREQFEGRLGEEALDAYNRGKEDASEGDE